MLPTITAHDEQLKDKTRPEQNAHFQNAIRAFLEQGEFTKAAALASETTLPGALRPLWESTIEAFFNQPEGLGGALNTLQFINDHLLLNQRLAACSILFPLLNASELTVAHKYITDNWFNTDSSRPSMQSIDKEFILQELGYACLSQLGLEARILLERISRSLLPEKQSPQQIQLEGYLTSRHALGPFFGKVAERLKPGTISASF